MVNSQSKSFWLKNRVALSQDCKSSSTFSSSRLHPTRKHPVLVLVSSTQAVQECCPKNLAVGFSAKNLTAIAFWSDCQMTDRARNQTGTQTDQRISRVLSALKSLDKLCGVWILFIVCLLKMQKLRQEFSSFQPSSPRLCSFWSPYLT